MSEMQSASKHRGKNWRVPVTTKAGGEGIDVTAETLNNILLQDIRDELRDLNRLLSCHNVVNGFIALQRIDKRLAKAAPLRPGRAKS